MVYRTFLVLALQVSVVAGLVNTDNSCMGPDGNYTAQAFMCKNTLDTASCEVIMPLVKDAKAPEVGNNAARPVKCFEAKELVNPDQKAMSIQQCAKTCGFCCETPAFKCENNPNPIHFTNGCGGVTVNHCKDPKWRPLVTTDCPNVCGFCNEDGCKDAVDDCKYDMCNNVNNQEFVKKNCIKTCQLCKKSPATVPAGVATTAAPGPNPIITAAPGPNGQTPCYDRPNCRAWARNGYCTHQFYTDADRAKACPVACGLCHLVGK